MCKDGKKYGPQDLVLVSFNAMLCLDANLWEITDISSALIFYALIVYYGIVIGYQFRDDGLFLELFIHLIDFNQKYCNPAYNSKSINKECTLQHSEIKIRLTPVYEGPSSETHNPVLAPLFHYIPGVRNLEVYKVCHSVTSWSRSCYHTSYERGLPL